MHPLLQDAIILQAGREAPVRKVSLARRATQEAKEPTASRGRLESRDLWVYLAYLVILDLQAIRDRQVVLEFKALKVIQVVLDCLAQLDRLLLEREGVLDQQEPPDQQDLKVLLASLVRMAAEVQLATLGLQALMVCIFSTRILQSLPLCMYAFYYLCHF